MYVVAPELKWTAGCMAEVACKHVCTLDVVLLKPCDGCTYFGVVVAVVAAAG